MTRVRGGDARGRRRGALDRGENRPGGPSSRREGEKEKKGERESESTGSRPKSDFGVFEFPFLLSLFIVQVSIQFWFGNFNSELNVNSLSDFIGSN